MPLYINVSWSRLLFVFLALFPLFLDFLAWYLFRLPVLCVDAVVLWSLSALWSLGAL